MFVGGNSYQSCLSIYSLDMSVLSRLVEEARLRYIEVSRAHVTIHMADVVRWTVLCILSYAVPYDFFLSCSPTTDLTLHGTWSSTKCEDLSALSFYKTA